MAACRRLSLKCLLAPLLAVSVAALPTPASSSTPTMIWTGAKRVNILCNVAGGPGIDHLALTKQLCGEVRRIAVRGAPMPVETISIGDPAVLASDAVTLLVHASVTTQGQQRLMAFSLRTHRSTTADATVLFGPAPRSVLLPTASASGPALSAELAAALFETLPWLARPTSPRRI